jgi:hypothetical protein
MTQDDLRTFLSASYGPTMVAPLLGAYANQTYPFNSNVSQWYWVAERTITDHQFACPTILATQWLLSSPSRAKEVAREIYQYYFTDGSPFVGHGAEVAYVFNKRWTFTSPQQQTLAYEFNDWWRTFIAGSAPTSDRCVSPVAWPSGEGNRTFTIADACKQDVAVNLKATECAVWKDYLVASTQQ